MVEGYNFLEGTQADINRRLLRRIIALENGEVGEIGRLQALETAVGDKDTDAGSLKKRCKDIETNVTALDTAIGVATSGSETGIHKDIKDINTAIGDASDPAEGTILYRLAELEKE